jgi:uncharacterized membrane protein YdjX (TVP38/TMEM64 family)
MLAHEHINRGVFPFFMIWSLYPAFPGQATPSAFGLFGVAKTRKGSVSKSSQLAFL